MTDMLLNWQVDSFKVESRWKVSLPPPVRGSPTSLPPFDLPSFSAFFFPEGRAESGVRVQLPVSVQQVLSSPALTFLQASLCGRQHLVNSEGVGSLFDAFVLHFLNVRQAVHGAAEVGLPRLWIGPVHAWLVFTYNPDKWTALTTLQLTNS